jgi:hypothetical protein
MTLPIDALAHLRLNPLELNTPFNSSCASPTKSRSPGEKLSRHRDKGCRLALRESFKWNGARTLAARLYFVERERRSTLGVIVKSPSPFSSKCGHSQIRRSIRYNPL